MNAQEIYKKKTGFDAYYHYGTQCKKYVKWLEKQFKTNINYDKNF